MSEKELSKNEAMFQKYVHMLRTSKNMGKTLTPIEHSEIVYQVKCAAGIQEEISKAVNEEKMDGFNNVEFFIALEDKEGAEFLHIEMRGEGSYTIWKINSLMHFTGRSMRPLD